MLLEHYLILKFDSNFKSNAVILFDDGKCARKENKYGQFYVLPEIEPVKSGEHVWRLKVKQIVSIYLQ